MEREDFRKWNRKRPESGTEAKTGNPAAGYEAKQQGIYISVAPNPRAELEETVRLIRRMVREEGMRYQDFAVLTGDLSVYGTYAREIFEKCGVPYFVDEKHSVLMNPFVEFLRAAIEMVVQSFRTRASSAICAAVFRVWTARRRMRWKTMCSRLVSAG